MNSMNARKTGGGPAARIRLEGCRLHPRRGRGIACFLVWLGAVLALPAARAQELSHDGRYWLEVEVIVFTQPSLPTGVPEHALPEKTRLEYPRNLTSLLPPGSSYTVEFPAPEPVLETPPGAGPVLGIAPNAPRTLNPPLSAQQRPFGPRYSPAKPDGFRLLDPARDPFVALRPPERKLAGAVRRLEGAEGRRVLYHEAWRQPLPSQGTGQWVFLRGGERYGANNELEGSFRLGGIPGALTVDLNLWFSRFLTPAAMGFNPTEWRLPAQPFPPARMGPEAAQGRPSAAPPIYWVEEVAPLRQSRRLTRNALGYFDHPRIGVLVQLRPYVLPEPEDFTSRFE